MTFNEVYKKAIKGLMKKNQYDYIIKHIKPNMSMLVFGAGFDTDLWTFLCKDILIVENDLTWFKESYFYYDYKSKVNIWMQLPPIPNQINRYWDIILIDSPRGNTKDMPGRQFPIGWASQLNYKFLFIHDFNRSWERKLCDHYLKKPKHLLRNLALYEAKYG